MDPLNSNFLLICALAAIPSLVVVIIVTVAIVRNRRNVLRRETGVPVWSGMGASPTNPDSTAVDHPHHHHTDGGEHHHHHHHSAPDASQGHSHGGFDSGGSHHSGGFDGGGGGVGGHH